MTSRIQISKERKLITYSDFWNTSRFLLENGQRNEQGAYYQFLASLTFSAFTFEAFLNHIGEHLFNSWPDLERKLSHRGKLSLISEKLEFKVEYDRLPWQIIPKLFGFRDKVAHGKNEMIRIEKTVPHDDNYEKLMHEFLFSDWQNFATEKNAVEVRKHLEEIMNRIFGLAKIENEHLFSHGGQSGSASIVHD